LAAAATGTIAYFDFLSNIGKIFIFLSNFLFHKFVLKNFVSHLVKILNSKKETKIAGGLEL
jgi:hypothetical protein